MSSGRGSFGQVLQNFCESGGKRRAASVRRLRKCRLRRLVHGGVTKPEREKSCSARHGLATHNCSSSISVAASSERLVPHDDVAEIRDGSVAILEVKLSRNLVESCVCPLDESRMESAEACARQRSAILSGALGRYGQDAWRVYGVLTGEG
jgi:hypothetical protein